MIIISAILVEVGMIIIAIAVNDYHTDLQSIDYELSRIADALIIMNRTAERCEE